MSLQSSLSKDNKRKFKKLISYNFAKIKFLLESDKKLLTFFRYSDKISYVNMWRRSSAG